MVKVRVLGISGSPRHGNTEILVKEALRGAEQMDEVETKFISLAGKKVNHCIGCLKCIYEGTPDRPCLVFDDDVKEIILEILEADALIIGSPAYVGSITSLLKAMMDRCEPLSRDAKHPKLRAGLKNKVGGAIVVGQNRHGGLETTMEIIHHFFLIRNMIVVGVDPKIEFPGCYYGAIGWSYTPHGKQDDCSVVKEDILGMRNAVGCGRRVAEIAKYIKAGMHEMSDK
jgi:multimeric flavodoxin WrbA